MYGHPGLVAEHAAAFKPTQENIMQTQSNDTPADLAEIFGEVISSYTRTQAIDDGMLVDVSHMAREAGFSFPVALTRAAWSDCVEWSEADSRRQT